MSHKAAIVERKQVPNGVALLMRCCDEPRSDQWLTLYPGSKAAVAIAQHQKNVESNHEALLKLEQDIEEATK